MKHKDAFWQRKQKKKEQNHISNIKFWTTQIFFRWGLKSWYQNFLTRYSGWFNISSINGGDVHARRSQPWLGFLLLTLGFLTHLTLNKAQPWPKNHWFMTGVERLSKHHHCSDVGLVVVWVKVKGAMDLWWERQRKWEPIEIEETLKTNVNYDSLLC